MGAHRSHENLQISFLDGYHMNELENNQMLRQNTPMYWRVQGGETNNIGKILAPDKPTGLEYPFAKYDGFSRNPEPVKARIAKEKADALRHKEEAAKAKEFADSFIDRPRGSAQDNGVSTS